MNPKSKSEFKLTLEDQLLLYCSHSQVNQELKYKISSLASSDLNWEHIMDMATRHRLRPLLYYNLNSICPEKVPKNILSGLKEFYQDNIRKNLMLAGELIQIVNLLRKSKIKSTTYKGPVLALAYGNLGLREFNDIDILIKKFEVLESKKIMLNNNYMLQPEINIEDIYYMRLDSEYRFISKNGARIEINWDFKGNFFNFSENCNFLFENLEIKEINNTQIHVPSILNHLLMLCIHNSKHNWNRLSWTCDISEYIQKENINWDELIEKAKKIRIFRILLINLILAKEIFDLELPKYVLKIIEQDKSAQKISNRIKKVIFSEEKLNIFEKFYWDLIKRENIRDSLKDCFNGLTKPTYTDYSDFKLPKHLFKSYFIIRPFLLLKRYYKKSI